MDHRVAVVSLGALFPDAKDTAQFWRNIREKHVSIAPMPEEMFESEVFYRPDLLAALNKEEKSTTRMAAWIKDLSFDTVRKYRIPPSVAEHMDPNQHAALYTTDQALASGALAGVDNDRVAVVFGNGMVGINYGHALVRVQFQLIEHYLEQNGLLADRLSPTERRDLVEYLRERSLKDTIPITEDDAPGILPNLIAGRIASVYDFHGPSFTIDAACASALAAIITGVQGLRLGEYDAVVCGASDMPLKQLGFIYFSALNALSPTGSFPFDERANGFVMGQGAGTVVLKRLEDALSHGDNVLAVITGYGEASDGKGKYIAAPSEAWQAHAIEQACRMAGYPVDTIEMIEAHGTATVVGDVVEVSALKRAFSNLGATRRNYCGLTSVKSNIGHLKSAAGIAGFVKAVLALKHKTLPPTASFQTLNPKLGLEDSPFYVIDEPKAWAANPEHPRRANVSAFGFGGADYHIAMEEYRPDRAARPTPVAKPSDRAAQNPPVRGAIVTQEGRASTHRESLVFFSADTMAALDAEVRRFVERVRCHSEIAFGEHCQLQNYGVSAERPLRLALLASSVEDLEAKYATYAETAAGKRGLLAAKGIYAGEGEPITPDQIAILFPGQASQYPNMLRAIHDGYQPFRALFAQADAYWLRQRDHTIGSLVYGDSLDEASAREQLKATQNAHPAIFATSFALYHLLADMGLRAKHMVGHSLGEITALAAAGKLSYTNALKLVEARGYAFHETPMADQGKMIAVAGSLEEVQEHVQESGRDVSIANINGPTQIIVSGSSDEIDLLAEYLASKKVRHTLLFVSHAFHSPLIEPVAERFRERIAEMPFRPSEMRVMANHLVAPYPDDPEKLADIPALLRDQIVRPVRFTESISKLADDGVRLFVEVGPGSVLSGLVKRILKGRDAMILTANPKGGDDLASLNKLLGALFGAGVPIAPLPASEGREATQPMVMAPQPAAAPESLRLTASAVQREAQPALAAARSATPRARIVYSGAAIGLPGSHKPSFSDDNFQSLYSGHNLIERLCDEERQELVDLRITKLVKSEAGPSFKLLASLDEVIQLAGKIGQLDLIRDYAIDERDAENMSSAIAHGVAAGYEALRDAQIPLVQEYIRTTSGKLLPHKLALPAEMQEETGVIFANGFPMIDPVIREVSRYISHKMGAKTRSELMAFYEGIIGRVNDDVARKLLTDWYALYYTRLSDRPGEDDLYQFNYGFMSQISAQANNRLASLINAKGPNLQLNAACSSTSVAVSVAEDFIRSGRVKRMIVIGADDATSRTNLPWLGAGFLSTGAATNEGDLYKAAVPFDLRRNGMIISAGAVGLVIETSDEATRRGVSPLCELLGTHAFNTAQDPTRIDPDQSALEMAKFVDRMEREHGLERRQLAEQLIYLAHETYTPPRGGCAQTEAIALEQTFGDAFGRILVSNIKGMTGHTMGAALEDAVAAKMLVSGRVAPVVNHEQPDPMLAGLNLAKGGTHDRSYVLKMSAGFGSQGHLVLLRKAASGPRRIADPERYKSWLREITGQDGTQLAQQGRLLIAETTRPVAKSAASEAAAPAMQASRPALADQRASAPLQAQAPGAAQAPRPDAIIEFLSQATQYPPEMLENEMEIEADLGITGERRSQVLSQIAAHFALGAAPLSLPSNATIGQLVDRVRHRAVAAPERTSAAPEETRRLDGLAGPTSLGGDAVDREALTRDVLDVFAEVTKYPVDMLELDMEMEADLGIDTVKQATILSLLGEKYRLERDESLQLSNYPTIGHIVDLVQELASRGQVSSPPDMAAATPDASAVTMGPRPQAPGDADSVQEDVPPAASSAPDALDRAALTEEVLGVFAEVTKYPVDMLELDMEMEADLGIDTVKQATILSMLGEKYRLERDESLQLSNYPTIGHIVDLVQELASRGQTDGLPPDHDPSEKTAVAEMHATVQSAGSELTRQVIVLAEAELGPKTLDLDDATVWVLGEGAGFEEDLASQLAQRGAHCEVLQLTEPLGEEEAAQLVADGLNKGAPEAIVDCSHVGAPVGFYGLASQDAARLLSLCGETRFAIYKALDARQARPAAILCLTARDGRLGFADGEASLHDPSYGALAGLYKALRKEWQGTRVKVLDVDPAAASSDRDGCIAQALDELECGGLGVEVCYRGSARLVAKIDEREIVAEESLTLGSEDTVLITGGSSGIGARVALALAERYPARLIINGRVVMPENVAELASLDEKGLEQLKNDMLQELRASHNRVTPALLNRRYGDLIKAIDVHRNLQRMHSLGRQVTYMACDVTDEAALGVELEKARSAFGPLTAIIHCAGVERSHLMAQKSLTEFRDVMAPKALGACHLMALCREDPLKLVVAFSSISGRFGNTAQLDYSAANGFLSDWIKMMRHARPGLHAVSLIWSGWKDVGMAWRNELVRDRSEELGLNLIEVDQGLDALFAEIENRTANAEVILHRGLDGFVEPGLSETSLAGLPLLDRVTKRDGRVERAYRVFSVKRDALIDQHRLGPVPILPAVGYSELAAEFYALQVGRKPHYVLRDLTFENAFKLFREEPRELYIEGQPSGEGEWKLAIKSRFRPALGLEPHIVLHSRATLSDTLSDLSDMDPSTWEMETEGLQSLAPDESLLLMQNSGPEQRIILGPLYNDVVRDSASKEPVLIYPSSTIYPTYFPQEQLTNDRYPLADLLTNPCFVDSMYQACAAHLLVNRKRVYLPWEVAELGIVRVPRDPGLYRSYTKVVEDSDDLVGFDVVMVDGEGEICYYARNARFRRISL